MEFNIFNMIIRKCRYPVKLGSLHSTTSRVCKGGMAFPIVFGCLCRISAGNLGKGRLNPFIGRLQILEVSGTCEQILLITKPII